GVAATVTITVVEAVHYVSLNSINPVPPYSSWATAATNIQDAVDAATGTGATVLVSNGTFAAGECRASGDSRNRVVVAKPLIIKSVEGPETTIIDGNGKMRCVYLANGAILSGFTLTNGSAENGAGVYAESLACVVTNCIVIGNSADAGGGAFQATMYNCRLTANSANKGGGACKCRLEDCVLCENHAYACWKHYRFEWWWSLGEGGGALSCAVNNCKLVGNSADNNGGGACDSTLYNCTVTGNSGQRGGGVHGTTAYDSIVYYNMADRGENHSDSTLNYCCTTPLPFEGVGNIDADPQLVSLGHIAASSPCRGAGNAAYAAGVDTDGEPWANPPSIGCDEVYAEVLTGPLAPTIRASFDNVAVGYPLNLEGFAEGNVTANAWEFGDGTRATNRVYVTHAWTSAGDYKLTFTVFNDSHPEGVSTNVTIRVSEAVHYVSANSANPVPPYSSWTTAATNIQDAVDLATVSGATVLVGSGTYATGQRESEDIELFSWYICRLAVAKPLIIKSVEGPQTTIIDGNGEMRCVHLANGAILSGFTLTNGSAWYGGGVYAEPSGCVITNCVLTGNSAWEHGGGAHGGTLYNCTLTGNSAWEGGGAYWGTLYNCTLTGNWADSEGGGASKSTLYNCTVTGNLATGNGGGAYGGALYNCTLTGNSADSGGGLSSGFDFETGRDLPCAANNCIVYFNKGGNYAGATMNYCCTTPLPTNGVGNIDADPRFVNAAAGDFRLLPDSPCIDAGTNLINIIATDIVGLPRPLDGNGDGVARFDIGAYEFNPYRFEPTLQFDAGGFAFTVRGEPGKLVRIERSRDLVTWELAAIVPLPASGQRLVDPAATTEPFVFYRAVTP
ncbi:MAG: PKD domain-containing protein, partial [Verrucomicrobia bacterium]|nr:PKD domain-containing protein [Verrucomicrobiota bacterium]